MAIFSDNFSDNSNDWLLRDNAEVSLQVEKGGYIIEHRRDAGWWATWKNFPNHTHSDLGIQIKIQRILGASDSTFGVVWGLIDTNNFYYVLLNLRKQFVVGRYINNLWHHLTPWTIAPIRQEVGSINEIAVFTRKSVLVLHINGFQVSGIEWNNVISGDNIGFFVGHCMKVKVITVTVSTENSVQIPQTAKFTLSSIKRTHVNSSNLKSVGYDRISQILEIEFKNGAVYQYYDVPQRIYVELMQTESHGNYFSAAIRDVFQYQQVQDKLTHQNTYHYSEEEDEDTSWIDEAQDFYSDMESDGYLDDD